MKGEQGEALLRVNEGCFTLMKGERNKGERRVNQKETLDYDEHFSVFKDTREIKYKKIT
jgi:hypothetical protein